jgi:hypothetical protein
MVAGGAILHIARTALPPPPGPRPPGPPPIRRLERDLGLNREQVEKLRTILDESRERMHDQAEATRSRIREILTPEQRARFDRMKPPPPPPGFPPPPDFPLLPADPRTAARGRRATARRGIGTASSPLTCPLARENSMYISPVSVTMSMIGSSSTQRDVGPDGWEVLTARVGEVDMFPITLSSIGSVRYPRGRMAARPSRGRAFARLAAGRLPLLAGVLVAGWASLG